MSNLLSGDLMSPIIIGAANWGLGSLLLESNKLKAQGCDILVDSGHKCCLVYRCLIWYFDKCHSGSKQKEIKDFLYKR
jgi:hypothetical protein